MWEVYEHRKLAKILSRISESVLQCYEKWKDIVRISGPGGLRLIRGFNDEPLRGKWKGYRSSRLNIQYRVIYKIDYQKVLVLVEKITPHDYGKN